MTKSYVIDGSKLLELRFQLGKNGKVSRKAFAEKVGMTVETLRSYENNRRRLTAEKFFEIKEKLGYYDSENERLKVMIDYLRITFKRVTDLDFFCRTYLYCPLSEFVAYDTKLMTYTNLCRRGDIWIFDYADKKESDNYQITLQLSGRGCRQFELILEREGLTWGQALQKMFYERTDMKVTRIDLALDEVYLGQGREGEQFSLYELVGKVLTKEAKVEKLKKWNQIAGGSLEEDVSDGISLYFGSRQSSYYFNFYEKRFEIAKSEDKPVDEILPVFDIWNRYEIRLNQKSAHAWVEEFINGVPLRDLSIGIINRNFTVYDGVNEQGFYQPDKKWQKLFGGVEPVELTTKPESYNVERTIKWLIHQVSNSLKLIEEIDRKLGTAYLKIIRDAGEITPEIQKILDQVKVGDYDYLRERVDFLDESY